MDADFGTEFAVELARTATLRGATAAEVMYLERTEFSVGVRLGAIETLEESADKSFGLRVLIEGRQASVSGSDFDREAVSSLVDQAIEMARVTSADDSAGLPEPDEFASSIPDLDLYDGSIARLSTEEKIDLALRAERAALDFSPQIVNFEGGGFDTAVGSMVLANSLGFVGQYSGSTCCLTSVPIASDGGRMQRDYWYEMHRKLSLMNSPEHIGRIAAQRTLRKVGACSVPTQTVPVVFEPDGARQLLGNLFQSASGESVLRKASFLVGQLGEKVASEKLTVVDDGTIPAAIGSRPFDAEGLPTRKTILIRNGILLNYLLNTYTARKLGLRSTANASRALVGAPSVSAGNLYIEPGPYSAEEIIGSVSDGLLVTDLIGFGFNAVTGDYSRSATGLWITNGKPTFPVQGITVAGNLKEMLNSIEMIGNDIECRGNLGSPTLLIRRMTLSA